MAVAGAWALALGGGRGTVVLGAPVDLSFDIQPDEGVDVAASCVTARLMAGDTPIADAKVRVQPWPDMRGRSPAVRVQALVAMDEPVLTVTLSAGCAGKVTRTYTFLTELPATVARSAAPVDVARLSSLPGAAANAPRTEPRTAPSTRPAPAEPVANRAAPVVPPSASSSAGVPLATRPAPRPTAAPPRVRKAAQPPVATPKAPTQARLVVEPLDDLWLERPVPLRTSPTLQAAPSDESSAQRAQAAALWKSLNAQPEDLGRDADRLKALEADMAALRKQADQDRASAAQVRQQLEQALEERFPATVVYALGGLLLAALLLLAWLWTRLRGGADKSMRAWRDSVAVMKRRDAVLAAQEDELGLTQHPDDTWQPPETLPPATPEPASARVSDLRSGAVPLTATFVDTLPRPDDRAFPPEGPSAEAGPPGQNIVSPEELFDIQQQAEFFISVGEHQQAIDVLKKHIAERGDASPLAYLELLRLYHTLSRVGEFGHLRTQFMNAFNAQVPEFAGFRRTGRMLYHYTDALAAIEAEWTSPSVQALLESFLFRRQSGEIVERFDLAAYDELLLLLAIAQTTPPSARGAPAPRKRTTPLGPERLEIEVAQAPPASPEPAVDPASADTLGAPLDLDLDLSDPPHITLSDLPPVPVTPAPAAGQAVGFGMRNDLVELRLELEPHEPNQPSQRNDR